ncbi:MAG: hypothetical protein NVSMB21_16280 [Vulcanimicrobiaceae bacterium]
MNERASGAVGRGAVTLVSIAFLIAVTEWSGVPSTRHDWLWPISQDAFVNVVLGWTSGWDPSGIGQPRFHLTQYLLAIPMLAIGTLFGSPLALAAYLSLIGATSSLLARQITDLQRLGIVAEFALAAFFVVNPWTYDELVAGHLSMILASACLGIIWVEISLGRRSRWLPLAMFGAATQPQFFVIAIVTCATYVRRPEARRCLLYGFIAFLPTTIGILSHAGAVEATPLNLDWEMVQSVAPADAILLRGYFAGYGAAFAGKLGTMASAVFVLLAFSSVLIARAATWRGGVGAALALVLATGLKGPFASGIARAFVFVPAIGLYRELYDLIGTIVVLYAMGAAVTMRRFPSTRWIALASVAAFAVLWLKAPPAKFWIPASVVTSTVPASVPGRYALVPAFQPLSFEDRGSGIDPAFAYDDSSNTPLNTYLPHFPETSALASYVSSGNATALESLGTNSIVCRKGFAEAEGVHGSAFRKPCSTRVIRASGRALLSLQDVGRLCSVCTNVGAGNVFFGDANVALRRRPSSVASASSFRRLTVPRQHSDAKVDWIDGRLAFQQRADLGQAFGGVYTRGSTPLEVGAAEFVLANVRGRLIDQRNDAVASNTDGYRWVRLRNRPSDLRCDGECAIALAGTPPTSPRDAPDVRSTPIAIRSLLPWISTARLPAGHAKILKYLVAYDPWWIALAGGRSYEHVRLDAAINGWLVPPRRAALTVTLVNLAAFAQFAAELVGVGAFCRCLWLWRSVRRP